jgi:hypothetical protein
MQPEGKLITQRPDETAVVIFAGNRRLAYLCNMRLAIAFVLLLATPALAAPTCEGQEGQAMRCGAPGAMPLGWTAPEENRRAPSADRRDVLEAAGLIVLLFALIALLPEFDGSRSEDWRPQDGEE